MFNDEMHDMGKTAWLLMDNCSTHCVPPGAEGCIWDADGLKFRGFKMSNTNVVFFPPNITSLKQPNDRGIIKSFKGSARKLQLRWVLDELDIGNASRADKAKPNVRQAIEWSRQAWDSMPMKTIQNCWNSANILPTPVAVAVGPQPDVMKELSDMLLLLAQAGETDLMSADEMCEIEEELLSALPLGVDEDEVEILAVAANMQEASTAVEDDSLYRVPVSLKVARQYMDELKYFFQENRPAMERHVEPAAAMIKDLTAMHISAYSVQSTLHAFFLPSPRPESDSGGCAAGRKAN